MEALKTEQRGGGRCKACDKVFSSTEIYWRKKLKLWEELCPSCRSVVLQDLLQLEEEPSSEISDLLPEIQPFISE